METKIGRLRKMGETIKEKKIKRYTKTIQKIVGLRRALEKDADIPYEFHELMCLLYTLYKAKIKKLEDEKDGQ